MGNKIRKQNLRRLRSEYGESFRRALAELKLTPEEFSAQSKIPLKFIEEHLSGEIRFLGHLNYISFIEQAHENRTGRLKLADRAN